MAKFSELSRAIQDKLHDKFCRGFDFSFHAEYLVDTAKTAGALLGFDVSKVYWSGFWSQGDGAVACGDYRYAPGAVAAIVREFPQDAELQRIARALQAAQRVAFYQLMATVTSSSYGHIPQVQVYDARDEYRSIRRDLENDIESELSDFSHWVYRTLEREYEYQTSMEVFAESLEGIEFDEEGEEI